MKNKQKTWEEKFDEKFCKYNKDTKIWKNGILKQFISELLDKEAKRRKKEKLETAQVNFKAGKNSQRLDVSTWKNIGKKYGYWKYFENQEKKELLEKIEKKAYAYDEKEDSGVVDFKDIIKIIKESK